MRDFLTSRFLLAAAIVGMGLIPSAPAAPPPPPPDPPPPPVMAAEDEIKPQPLPPIPDDPPPHEGAMIDYPIVVEPPDLILVEVIEALPGRPISGERLVRPDGTISLGFYGDVHVRGLTTRQIKIKIIKRLRYFLPDEVLGLIECCPPDMIPPQMPKLPEGEAGGAPEEKTERDEVNPEVPSRAIKPDDQSAAMTLPSTPSRSPLTTIRRSVENPAGCGEVASDAVEDRPKVTPPIPEIDPSLPRDRYADGTGAVYVAPADSDRVFVDVTAYNSKIYYVEGDAAAPGKLPWVGNETVLDAIHNAQGLIPTGDPKNIRLVRPSRGGKPARVYPIDLEAIKERGEIEKNYQIFPGDRIIVGRDAVVKTTLEMERFAAPMRTVFNSILQQTFAVRSLMLTASGGTADMSPEQREALVKEWADLWWKLISRPAGAELDEKTFREALMRAINPPGAEKPPEEKK